MGQLRQKPTNLNIPLNSDGLPAPLEADGTLSYEAFLDWADEDVHAEWIDGEIEMSSPSSYEHQSIASFLLQLINTYLRFQDKGGTVLATFAMKLPNQPLKRGAGREPDLLYLKSENMGRLHRNTFVDGPADLAIEIISPESIERDQQIKYKEYAVGRVAEYWLINPLDSTAIFYQLDANQQYQTIAPDGDGKYHSREINGLWVHPNWLWQKNLPAVEGVMFDIAGESYFNFLLAQARQSGLNP